MATDRLRFWMVPCASVTALVMLAQLVAGRATREALFLANFSADDLPYAMGAAGVLSVAGSIPAARALARFGPGRVVPIFFALSASLFTLEWLWAARAPEWVAAILYLHLAAASTLLISGFWAVLNERFDPHSARASLARVASFATAGGMLGGLISERVGVLFGLDTTLIVMAGMHAFCASLVALIGRAEPITTQSPDQPEALVGAFEAIRSTPYLKLLISTTVIFAILDAPLDFAIRAEAANEFKSGKELIRFFGFYYTAVGVATFLMQSAFTEKMIARLGIGPSMAVMPAMAIVTGIAALFSPVLAAFVALRGTTSVLTNSVYRTGFELLYTPLPLRLKRPAKPVIDVGGDGLGDVLGAGLVLLVIALWPVHQLIGVTLAAIAFAIVLMVILRRLQKAYLNRLADNLEEGDLVSVVDDGPVPDVTHSHLQLDRSAIRARLHEVRVSDLDASEKTGTSVSEWLDALADASQARWAVSQLSEQGDGAKDLLIDALSDPNRSDLAKLFLPGLLEKIADPRVVEALLNTMGGASFEVRFRSARSAARLIELDSALEPDSNRVLDALREEFANPRSLPPIESISVAEDRSESVLIADYPNLVVGRRLEHVLTVLALDHGRDLMRSILLGLYSNQPAFSGNALEYLDTSLPEDLRRQLPRALGPRLSGGGGRDRRGQMKRDLKAELLRQSQARILNEHSDE